MKNKNKKSSVSPLMKTLSAYLAKAQSRRLPSRIVEVTKHHVLDTIAAMVSGVNLPPGKAAISYVKQQGSNPRCTVIGSKLLTDAATAALANGMLGHADETDDSHAASLTHPGCAIVAAALAVGEHQRCSGDVFLRAVAAGYDVSSRMGIALGGEPFRKVGHSTHGMAPAFGGAAAGAVIAGLSATQMQYALSYAAQQSSGVSCYTSDVDHIEKSFDFGGMPARNGVTAALMVASGCTGVQDVFSGERNFFMAFDESLRIGKKPESEELIRELGKTYEIANTNIKRWSVGSPIQAPLDSLLELIRAEEIKAPQVEKLVVRLSHLGANTTSNRDMPNICMQYMCAAMLIDGMVTFDSAHDVKRMQDAKIRELWKRIELVGDDELHRLRIERGERHGIVELTLKDGRQLRHHTKAVKGTKENPMVRAEVDEKCFYLIAPVFGKQKARQLCDAIWNLEAVSDLRKLRKVLQK